MVEQDESIVVPVSSVESESPFACRFFSGMERTEKLSSIVFSLWLESLKDPIFRKALKDADLALDNIMAEPPPTLLLVVVVVISSGLLLIVMIVVIVCCSCSLVHENRLEMKQAPLQL